MKNKTIHQTDLQRRIQPGPSHESVFSFRPRNFLTLSRKSGSKNTVINLNHVTWIELKKITKIKSVGFNCDDPIEVDHYDIHFTNGDVLTVDVYDDYHEIITALKEVGIDAEVVADKESLSLSPTPQKEPQQ